MIVSAVSSTTTRPAIGNYLRRRLYPLTLADLDDLVEETLLVVWRRIDSVPEEAELPWMIGVARNVLRNARRSQYRRTNFESTLPAAPDDPSAEDLVIADASVRDALISLNDDDREVLMLNAWDGLDTHALGVALSITTNAAAVRLSRAQARFRERFAAAQVILKVSSRVATRTRYAGGGAFMSDFEERLRAADPAAASSYEHPDTNAMISRIMARAPRARRHVLRSFQFGWPDPSPSPRPWPSAASPRSTVPRQASRSSPWPRRTAPVRRVPPTAPPRSCPEAA